ncbi:MAG TPA: hypothetical protein VL096_04760 [Pirellulaceae bacterium]|nr:hypothetical protein [Pirellulaceae bacterium]
MKWSKICIRGLLAHGSLAMALTVGTGTLALAQPAVAPPAAAPVEYQVIDLAPTIWKNGKPTEAMEKMGRLQIAQLLKGDLAFAANESLFDSYYTRYKFAVMTQTNEDQLAKLQQERRAFMEQHLKKAVSPEAHDHLVDLTFRSMKKICTENFHPAVRYNAMLIIGDLNVKEGITGGANAGPADPLPAARDFMLAELVNPQQIDAVKLAAIIGLTRHAEINALRPADRQYTNAVRAAMIKQLLPLAADKKVPATRSDEGHAWMRGRLYELLTALSLAGYDNNVAQLLTQTVGDESEPFSLRFVAADLLGRMNLAASTTLTGADVARKVADLLTQSSRAQLALLEEEIAIEKAKARLSGGGALPGRPPVRMELNQNPTDPVEIKREKRLLLVRRILKNRAQRATTGLNGADGKLGAASVMKASQKDYVTKVTASVAALGKVAETTNPTIYDLAKEMKAKILALEQVAKTGGAPPAVAPAVPAVPAVEGPGAEGPGAEGPGTEAAKAAPPAEGPAAEGPGT